MNERNETTVLEALMRLYLRDRRGAPQPEPTKAVAGEAGLSLQAASAALKRLEERYIVDSVTLWEDTRERSYGSVVGQHKVNGWQPSRRYLVARLRAAESPSGGWTLTTSDGQAVGW